MKEEIVGSWMARRDGQINAQSFAECSDILTMDSDGRVFRQFDTTEVVKRKTGEVERYQVIVTLVGVYEYDGDVLTFKDLKPRYESSRFNFDPSGCAPGHKVKLTKREIEENGRSKLNSKVGEVMTNKAVECMQSISGQIPTCHVRMEGNALIMKWDGYDIEDKMVRCDEPADLDRCTEGLPIEVAVKIPEQNLYEAIRKGDCRYLKNTSLFLPCNYSEQGDSIRIMFKTIEAQGMKLIVAFTDANTMSQSELIAQYPYRECADIQQLIPYLSVYDGLCVNPVQGHSICLRKEMVQAMVEDRWGGISDDGKFIIK